MLRLRGHHLLCIQGFRGLGYNDFFVRKMREVTKSLSDQPEQPIEVVAEPDEICQACPHLREGCSKNQQDREEKVRMKDRRVLAKLGLAEMEQKTYREILMSIKTRVQPEDLLVLCKECSWLSLGYCREGIA